MSCPRGNTICLPLSSPHRTLEPVPDRHLTSLISRLLEERDERRAARARQFAFSEPRPLEGVGGAFFCPGIQRRHNVGCAPGAQGALVVLGFVALDDDVAAYHLHVLVAQGAEHGEGGVVGDCEGDVGAVGLHEGTDVYDGGEVGEEASVRAGHVVAHLVDEVVGGGWCVFVGRRVAVEGGWRSRQMKFAVMMGVGMGRLDAGGPMLNPENDVEKLDQGGLRIATATVLDVWIASTASVEDHAVGKAGICHVLAPGKKRPDAMVEDMRVIILVHALENCAKLVETLREYAKA